MSKEAYHLTYQWTRTSMDEIGAVMEKHLGIEQGPAGKRRLMFDGGTEYRLSVAKNRETTKKDNGRVAMSYISLTDKEPIRMGN